MFSFSVANIGNESLPLDARCSQFRVNLDNLHQVFLLTLVDLNENIKLFIVIARDSRRAKHFYSNAFRSDNETRLLGTSCQPNENSEIRLRSFSVSSFLLLKKLGENEGEMINGKVAQNNSRRRNYNRIRPETT